MAVEINCSRIDDDLILVNGKKVQRNMDGMWITQDHMNVMEAKFFNEFLETLERCDYRKPTKAIYTV